MWARGIVPSSSSSPAHRCLLAVLAAAWGAGPALAHGAIVEAAPTSAVAVQARYDSGAPMAGARVTVFAPDDPARPWAVGQADADGRFLFRPDPSRPGRWAVQARQAGHGGMAYLDIAAGPDPAAPDPAGAAVPAPGLTWPQRLLMLACVGWGCIGTAAYFLRSRGGAGAA